MLSSWPQVTRPKLPVPTQEEALIAALLEERRGYLVRQLPDRVALVDHELSRLGHVVKPPARNGRGGSRVASSSPRDRDNQSNKD